MLLVDYHLKTASTGLTPWMPARARSAPPGGFTRRRDQLKRAARARGYRVLTKPTSRQSLRAFLAAGGRARGV